MGTQPLPKKGAEPPPQFSAHFYCRQTAECTKMQLGMEVGLGPGDCVRRGSSPLHKKGSEPTPEKKGTSISQFLAHVYCGETAGWMKTPLRTEVDLGPGHIVLDGVPALRERGIAAPPLFWTHVYCGHGRPSQLLMSFCLNRNGLSDAQYTSSKSVALRANAQ